MKKASILIVEDELLIAKNISIILENEGYETFYGITDYVTACSLLEEKVFNLVLIDIQLNGISDGVDLGRYLSNKNTIPFIFITSNTDAITVNRVKETRPHGFIVKPFKPIDILTTVEIVLNNFSHVKIDSFRYQNGIIDDDVPFILKKVVDYINDNISERITIEQLSSLTKWSPQHFTLLFKKFLDQTPYQYILIKKIEKAKSEIVEDESILLNISLGLGFKSYSNFCNAFQKITGQTPEQFKKKNNINKFLS